MASRRACSRRSSAAYRIAQSQLGRGQPKAHRLPGRGRRRGRTRPVARRHHEELFRQELNGWYTDSALWPRTGPSRCFGSGVPSSSTQWWWTPVKLRSKTTSSKNEPSRTTNRQCGSRFSTPTRPSETAAPSLPGRPLGRPKSRVRGREDALPERPPGYTHGSVTAKREPLAGSLSASIRPPSASTMRLVSARPRPAPEP